MERNPGPLTSKSQYNFVFVATLTINSTIDIAAELQEVTDESLSKRLIV